MKKLSLILILLFCAVSFSQPIQPVITREGKFNTLLLDTNNTEAILARQDGDANDVFAVDTTNRRVGINNPNWALSPTAHLYLVHPAGAAAAGDSDSHIITMQATGDNEQRVYFRWNDKDGNQDWLMGKNAVSTFILYGSGGSLDTHRLQFIEDGITYIDSAGAQAVRINANSEANSGTGGLMVGSGGATPASLFAVQAANTYVLNDLWIKPDGSTVTTYFRDGDILFYKPIEIYEGAADALIVKDGVGGNTVFQVNTTTRRVGINKAPLEVFDVNGSALISSTLGVTGATTIGSLISTPDEITATDSGVAASVATANTEVTTNGDTDLDNVTLANGTSGQIKHIYCVVEGNAGDTWKITPATMCGGTQITFAGVGEGCTLVYADNEGWVVVANNGGTIS